MLTARIKIGGDDVRDSRYWGLVYLDSDKALAAPIKGFEETSYPEQEGVNISPKTVDDAFDYKVKFFIQASTLEKANDKIAAFNSALYTQAQGSDVKEFKQVEFYNDYKRHKIVGYPHPIPEADKFWRDTHNPPLVSDVVTVEWLIRVNKPSECDFSLQ